MKRVLSAILVIVLLVSMVACGNGNTQNDSQTAPKETAAQSNAQETSETSYGMNPAGVFPIVKDKIQVKIFCRFEANMEDMQTNEFSKLLEEKSNISVTYEGVPDDVLWDKVNLLIASNDLPDAFMNTWLGPMHEQKFGVEEKQLIPVTALIDKYMPNFKKVIETYSWMKGAITATDKEIYGLPGIMDNYHTQYQQKAWINKALLDKYGLAIPKTTDEFYQVLKDFKSKEKKGIPYVGATNGWCTNVDTFVLNAFTTDTGMYNNMKTYVDKDGKVKTSVNTQEYRDGLRYLNTLYKDGLINPASFTQNGDQLAQLISTGSVLCVANGGYPVNVTASPEIAKNYVALEPIAGPSGLKQSPLIPNYPFQMMFTITKSCKYPEAMVRWADLFYDRDIQLSRMYGVKGRDWEDVSSGQGTNGVAATYKVNKSYNYTDKQNSVWLTNGIWVGTSEWILGRAVDTSVDRYSGAGGEMLLNEESKRAYEPYSSMKVSGTVNTPPLKMTGPEFKELENILTAEIDKLVSEYRTKFITGELSVDKDWDNYVKKLDDLQLPKYMELMQKAYDNAGYNTSSK